MRRPYLVANFALTLVVIAFAICWSIDLVEDVKSSKAQLTSDAISAQRLSADGTVIPDGFVNSPHPDAPNIQIIGVRHTAGTFHEFAPAILAGIDNAEIVLLERGTGYFDSIAAYAHLEGKTVYYVDKTGNEDIDHLPEVMPIALLFATLVLLANLPMTRVWHIPAYLLPVIIFMSASFPNPIDNFLDRHGEAQLSRYYAANWVTEGRTLEMSDLAIELAAGRKAVLIQGNWHSDGIFWYHAHPNVERFQRIYQKLFWWWVPTSSKAEVGFPDKTNPARTNNAS